MKFEDMNIDENVLSSLKDIGFENPTRIQLETIPLIKEGYDVIGQSETGSGKTAAFGIPLIEKMVKGHGLQALILAPTRELAQQTASELIKFSRHKGLFIQTVYGGVSMEPQVFGLRKAEIVVGTPGRILDHMWRGNVETNNLKIFVLDEADEMIDMGFIEDIEEIERNIPKERQTLLFSATMPECLIGMREKFTKNARKIRTNTKVKEELLKQYYCDIDQGRKFSLLVHLINEEKPQLSIIFCNSRRDANMVAVNLQTNGINADVLHGGLTQSRRDFVIQNFHKRVIKVLVATDVAARGLDIKNVTHIFNYSIPKNSEDYVNRIGRTARAGESGKAISLLTREDHVAFQRILRDFRYEVERLEVSDFKILPFDTGRSHEFSERRSFGRFGHRGFGRNIHRR